MNGSSAFAQQQILLETVPRHMENKEVTGDGQRGFSKEGQIMPDQFVPSLMGL